MPRDGSGVATKPAGTTASPNTTIESAKFNSVIDDIYALLNAALPVTAGGTGSVSAAAARTALAAAGLTDENTFTKTQIWAKGADVASANALATGDDGNYFDITGTTSITSIATVGVGAVIKLHFDAALVLTHHATDLVLPGGANITTAAGDEAEFAEYAAGDWRCVNYQRANSAPPTAGWDTLACEAFSGVASINVINAGAYVRLKISGYIVPSDDAVSISFRTRTGGVVDSGGSDYDFLRSFSQLGVVGTNGSTATAAVPLSLSNVGNASNEAIRFAIEIEQFNKATWAWGHLSCSETASDGTRSSVWGEFRRLSTTGRDGLTIAVAPGGTIAGNWMVEGMRG